MSLVGIRKLFHMSNSYQLMSLLQHQQTAHWGCGMWKKAYQWVLTIFNLLWPGEIRAKEQENGEGKKKFWIVIDIMLSLTINVYIWRFYFVLKFAIEFLQVRTFRGHTNEKNFVGLSVNSEYIACGSETNEVFVYHKVSIYRYICHLFMNNLSMSANWSNIKLHWL